VSNAGKNVDDILQQGIYGKKEINPEERKQFLGTLRERIVAVLLQAQVREKERYPELIDLMKKHSKARLYLNGAINISDLKKYIDAAETLDLPYKIVINNEYDTEIGLILAYDYAIDQEMIYLKKQEKPTKLTKQKKKSPGFFASILKKFKHK
jgi:uncharacterized protein YueI